MTKKQQSLNVLSSEEQDIFQEIMNIGFGSAAADLAMGQPGHDRGFHAPPVDELSGRGPYGDPSQAQRSQIPVE